MELAVHRKPMSHSVDFQIAGVPGMRLIHNFSDGLDCQPGS